MSAVRLFFGTDIHNFKAERALEFSLRRHASRPVEVAFMRAGGGDALWRSWNTRGWMTSFSAFRWAIPELCGFQGRAVYLDCDMLVLGDVAELASLFDNTELFDKTGLPDNTALPDKPALISLADEPSVLVFDCARFATLADWPSIERMRHDGVKTRDVFARLKRAGLVGPLPLEWNCLDGRGFDPKRTKLMHFTHQNTQPWHPKPHKIGYEPHPLPELAALWLRYYEESFSGTLGGSAGGGGSADAAAARRSLPATLRRDRATADAVNGTRSVPATLADGRKNPSLALRAGMRRAFEELAGRFPGVVTIVGKGPTEFDYARLADEPGPVLFINEAVTLAGRHRPGRKGTNFLFAHDRALAPLVCDSPDYTCVLPADKGGPRFDESFIDASGRPAAEYALFYRTKATDAETRRLDELLALKETRRVSEEQNEHSLARRASEGHANDCSRAATARRSVPATLKSDGATADAVNGTRSVPATLRDMVRRARWLKTYNGTIVSAAVFAWYLGATRVRFVGCDGINDRKRVAALGGVGGYEARLAGAIVTKPWWQYTEIRRACEAVLRRLGVPFEYAGTPGGGNGEGGMGNGE